jgi:ubiquinone/menaquinone biosynthesis C-methylase UbiE
VSWEVFDREAGGYEGWYATLAGQRADRAEWNVLAWALSYFPLARSALEVGCGSGHFSRWLSGKGLRVVGLDRAPAMLAESRRRSPGIPVVLGDAHHLPFRDGAVDLALFVVTLEFLEDPPVALAEAVRVARQGLVVVALNRWSLGGISRRRAFYQKRHRLLGQAADQTLPSLRALLRNAAGRRWQAAHWTSGLFPGLLWRMRIRLPLGDVIGLAARLAPPRRNTNALGVDAPGHDQGPPGSVRGGSTPLL